jgi:glycosyltransferase involved in cell wall biosynthesis/tetratricopeptide (TPR) repeat protein
MGMSLRHRLWPWQRSTDEQVEETPPVDLSTDAAVETEIRPVDPGRQAVIDNDWPNAARIWGERALKDPKNSRNHRHYIRSLIRMDRLYEAAAACDIARKHHRKDGEFLLRRLWLLDRLGIEDTFRKELRSPGVSEAVSDSGRMALIAGRHYWRRGALSAAREFFLKAADDPETRSRAALHLARLDYRAGDMDTAKSRWSDIIADPDSAGHAEEPYLFLGRIELKCGDLEAAAEHFDRARDIEPSTSVRIDKWMPRFPSPDAIEPSIPIAQDTLPLLEQLPLTDDLFPADIDVEPGLLPVEAELGPLEPLATEPEGPPLDSLPDQIATAREHLDAKRLQEALEDALGVLSVDEDNSEACEIAGFAANRSADWKNAAFAWGRLADLQPFRIGPMFQAASACEQLGDRSGALEFGERILKLEPTNDTALALCARQLSRSGDLDGLRTFSARVEALELQELPDRLVMTLVDGFAGLKARAEASVWIDRAMQADAPSDQARLRKARLLYADGDFQSAEAIWQQLLDVPDSVVRAFEPHVFIARCAIRLGETEKAIQHFREAVRLNAGHLESRDGLIGALMKHGDFHAADAENLKFRKQFPGEAKPLTTSVLIGYRLRDPSEIEARCNYALDELAGDAAGLIQLGRIIESQRDDIRALAHWSMLAEHFPGNADVLHRLVIQQFAIGGDDRAARETARVLQQASPDHESGLFYLASLNQRLGDVDEAHRIYQRGLKLYPANIGFWIGHASALMRADKVAQARGLLDEARTFTEEDDPVALADLARLAEIADLPDAAEDFFNRAIEIAPSNLQTWRRAVRFHMNRGAYGKAWDMALEGRRIDRSDGIISSALVQTSAVLQMLKPDWATDEKREHRDVLIPDDLLECIARKSWQRPDTAAKPDRRGAMLITSSLGSGGSERQVMFSMQALARVDHGLDDVTLVARSLNPDHSHDFFLPLVNQSGFPVINLGDREPMDFVRDMGSSILPHREAVRIAAAMPPEILAMALPLLGVFLKHRPEVVHTWQDTVNIAGALAALLAGVPRIVMGTRSTRPDARRRMRRYLEPGYHAMLALPQISMVNNSHNGARDYEDWLALPQGSVGVIHNGFDVDAIRAAASTVPDGDTPSSLGIPHDAAVIGGVMRFSEEKRPELFVDAAIALAPRLPQMHFMLIGDGPLRAELQAKVAAAGLADRIHLPGAKRPVEPWMNRMSILVLTSRMEGLPNVLIEAQILGVPVAATKVGGVPETMIENETGIMVDSSDPAVLADHLYEMAADEGRLQIMGQAAKDWAEGNFSLEGMIRNTLGFYQPPGD